jgi:hypothetical protein
MIEGIPADEYGASAATALGGKAAAAGVEGNREVGGALRRWWTNTTIS